MDPESYTGHKLSFCFTFLCDPDLGQRTLTLIMTYQLIIVYLFIMSIKLALVVFFRNAKKRLDLQPLTLTLTLSVNTMSCMWYTSEDASSSYEV